MRLARPLLLELGRPLPHRQPLEKSQRNPRRHAASKNYQQGPEKTRAQFRRPHHHLRLHAVDRHGR